MIKKTVTTNSAPCAIGPYSQGIIAGDMIFTSGQMGLDPATGAFPEGGIEAQARQALLNMKAVLEAGGSGIDRVLKTTVFLKHMNDFAAVNGVYAGFFDEKAFPARSAVEVSRLPKDALVEIECIALI